MHRVLWHNYLSCQSAHFSVSIGTNTFVRFGTILDADDSHLCWMRTVLNGRGRAGRHADEDGSRWERGSVGMRMRIGRDSSASGTAGAAEADEDYPHRPASQRQCGSGPSASRRIAVPTRMRTIRIQEAGRGSSASEFLDRPHPHPHSDPFPRPLLLLRLP